MNYLSIENLTKSYGELLLFEDISFGIEKGQKVALIAKNGTGKTTLFKVISRLDEADSGNVTFNNEAKIAFLHQDPNLNEELTILDAVFDSDTEIISTIKSYELAMISENPDSIQKVLPEMDRLQAWDYEQKIAEILSKFKVGKLDQKIGELSGGQKKRVALAKVLIENADFLILDEPTNHLDLEMIEWLEEYLSQQNITIFMVTHDRYFLERVCNEIMELDEKTIFRYKGNYSYFLEKKSEREEKKTLDVVKAKNLMRKELDWMRRMPKARGTKSKDRIDRFYKLEEKASTNLQESELKLEIIPRRLGGKILEMHHVDKSFEEVVILKNFSYLFQKRERLGIIGNNGSGKTTFLNLISKNMSPDSGEIVVGETIVMGYYKQENQHFPEGKRVIEVIRDIAEYIPTKSGNNLTAAQMLERFLFPRKMHFVHVSKLSGGEKRRLHLLTVLMKNPNFLILDEPTNDLDILTLNILEEFLIEFQGCLVVVTHDRYFMDKMVEHLFIFEGNGKIKDYNGKYTEYWNEKQKQKPKPTSAIKKEKKEKPKQTKEKNKLTYKEKLEFEKLENEIKELEAEKTDIENQINEGDLSHSELTEKSERLTSISELIEEKEMRWLELSEYN
jgi:ATP-binding cassette subfamily F protein uup